MTPSAFGQSANGAQRPRWPLYLALGIALAVWCAVDVQRRGRIDPDRPSVHRTDFTCYTEAGGAFFDGRDPYAVTNARGWGYCYPPLFALLVSPLASLDPQWQVSIWFIISVAVVWGLYRECAFLFAAYAPLAAREAGQSKIPRAFAVAAVAAGTLPVLNCLQRGQVDVLKLYLLLVGVRLCLTGPAWHSWFVGGIALAAAIVLKITPLLPVGFFMLILLARFALRRADDPAAGKRFATAFGGLACGAVALLLVVPGAIVGWNANLSYLERFYQDKLVKANDYQEADKTGNQRTLRNQSFSNAVIRLGDFIGYEFLGGPDDRLIDSDWRDAPRMIMDEPGVVYVLMAARGTAVMLLVAAGLLCVKRGDVLGQVATIGMACAAALVVSPISRGSYYAELVPGVLLMPLWCWANRMPGAARALCWAPALLVIVYYLALPIAGRVGLLGIGTATWYATGLSLLVVGRRAVRPIEPLIPAPIALRRRERSVPA